MSTMKTQNKYGLWLFGLFLSTVLVSIACAVDRPSDETISYWVKEAMREDPRVQESDIAVTTREGIVTLSGTTRNLTEKTYADLEAKKIQGVLGVIDELIVTPVSRFDMDIAQDIRQRLIYNATIHWYALKVDVADGMVSLGGAVNSIAEAKEAELLASEVLGVKTVHNNLTIEYLTSRSDEEIKLDVLAALHRDVYLTDLPITVTVEEGSVTLTGKVGNTYQKDRAGEQIWMVGNVKSVKNNLDVEWWKEQGVREKAPLPTNDQLKQAVLDELHQDIRIESFNVTVDAIDGDVSLRGNVPTYHQKQLAERDAWEVIGVAWVNNLLSIKTELRSDLSILHDLQAAINSDYSLNGQDIQVLVKDGKVTLSGNVNEYYERHHASRVISKIRGVRDVVNKLVVNSSPKYTNASLQKRIQDRLFASAETRWVAGQIQVQVENGQATLTGKVNTWSERQEAGRITSLTDGIFSVVNLLTVADTNYPWENWHYLWPYMP